MVGGHQNERRLASCLSQAVQHAKTIQAGQSVITNDKVGSAIENGVDCGPSVFKLEDFEAVSREQARQASAKYGVVFDDQYSRFVVRHSEVTPGLKQQELTHFTSRR
jgi:hypothetical protein